MRKKCGRRILRNSGISAADLSAVFSPRQPFPLFTENAAGGTLNNEKADGAQMRPEFRTLPRKGALHKYYGTGDGAGAAAPRIRQKEIRRNKILEDTKQYPHATAFGTVPENLATPGEKRWPAMICALAEYKKEHGNAEVPASYRSPDGLRLGAWLQKQRSRANGTVSPPLQEWQKTILSRAGMVWDVPGSRWESMFTEAAKYRREHGNLLVPYAYVTPDGILLGKWIHTQRKAKKNQGGCKTTDERIQLLESIGMVWDAGPQAMKAREIMSAGQRAAKAHTAVRSM